MWGNPLSFVDPFGLDKTIWLPGLGRTILDAEEWKLGAVNGVEVFLAEVRECATLDSGDACYMSMISATIREHRKILQC